MNARERWNAVMQFEKPDRLPFMEFMAYWPETLDRWYGEGMPRDVSPQEYFGYDPFEWIPVDFNPYPAFEQEVLDEDEQTRTVVDATGVIKREFKTGSAMPHFIKFPISTREDFLAFKERLIADEPQRYPAEWPAMVERYRNRDFPVGLVNRGLVAFMRDFMDFNEMMMAFMEQPEWVGEMMDFHTDFTIRLWDKVLSEVEVDMIQLGEDMAFKTGPMISPALIEHFMVPRYKKICDFLRSHGVKTIIVDSDGDIRSALPLFIEAGITGILPCESTANCDPLEVRRNHPRFQIVGGLAKAAIAEGGDTMEREVRENVGVLGPLGGYVPSFDHSVHPATSFETYKKYLERLWAYCNEAV